MPVNLIPPTAADVLAVPGVRWGVVEAGIRKANRKDVSVCVLPQGARVDAVFTQNRFCAAPVQVCQTHLASGAEIRALVINTGNANAGTGQAGLRDARAMAEAGAKALGLHVEQVLPFSTGVILEPLPIARVVAGIAKAAEALSEANWLTAAQGIMTTDTQPKACSRQCVVAGQTVTVTGIAKGAGMIRPNMATMLGFVATDAQIDPKAMVGLAKTLADQSFNRVTVDGDTSTNDSFVVMATGQAGNDAITDWAVSDAAVLLSTLKDVARDLAHAIVRDGEGATKFITIQVNGGRNTDECLKVAYAVAHSPLVKTAFFASDPNLGRILAAVGYAGVDDLDVNGVDVYLDDVQVAHQGGLFAGYTEAQGAAVMVKSDITVRIDLGRGDARDTVWTCDFSHDYVSINADYRS
ncbi:MAG: bifunctional glutamate N-acetyltransferase/amino-acid acetyltransferase ArgJ [Burkholderiaceae bacterium]|jgi:glutamate N-acetyltransferase/amino-acid N-acetyltransferase|nr:bifunctional glutamate N-acetyltransferase/amino-acid acetyltransferase ArgJ [Betaproteobacteria bacterium]MDA8599584.1 bifunctional glutamate N-acetyltransferase/amino-acid acetyltransferase ArgJ [Burkholderiaceae bacterium]MDO7553644.1 bifunctional glutamate N-acetyltransferase/amino-acid acetyltransferase ArgJ [Burkholderiaceae bacterium]MDO7579554.1 bifunctional glutamate N-acetyltransferase/amino-acid acetyltransferase ArgJ [Burkholderiaceae bacterium]MDO7595014.1 bifunctional glutamate